MENVAMRTFDFTPFYRSTVGFDRLFDSLDNSVRPDWPPYDIEKIGEDQYRITMAVAGFSQAEIQITQEGANLLVIGQKAPAKEDKLVLHRGIAGRNFKQIFNLADHVKVAAAELDNGMLAIDLVHEVPEQLKPRRIEIKGSSPTSPAKNDPKQIEGEPGRKAA